MDPALEVIILRNLTYNSKKRSHFIKADCPPHHVSLFELFPGGPEPLPTIPIASGRGPCQEGTRTLPVSKRGPGRGGVPGQGLRLTTALCRMAGTQESASKQAATCTPTWTRPQPRPAGNDRTARACTVGSTVRPCASRPEGDETVHTGQSPAAHLGALLLRKHRSAKGKHRMGAVKTN